MAGSTAEISAALGEFLHGEVSELTRLSGGASRETFAFTLHPETDGPRPLILQRIRSGPVASSFSMEDEATLLRAAAQGGVPVAPVVAASDDAGLIGAPFVVVERLEGETIARRLLRDEAYATARGVIIRDSARALAAVHQIAPDDAPGLDAQDQLGSLQGLYEMLAPSMGPHPAFALAFRQLDRERPRIRHDVVLHGDFRLGNLLIDADGLVAALDWELAHLGDPLEDLAWFSIRAWSFGGAGGEVAGVGSLDELAEAYEAASSTLVDRDALKWWRAVETLRWGVICMLQAHTHLSGASRSIELAAIGRRVCETEYDLLRLLR